MEQVDVARKALMQTKQRFATSMIQDSESILGLGSSAYQHWIGSGPEVRPCDLSDSWNIQDWQTKNLNETNFVFAMQPRHAPKIRNEALRNDANLRHKDYYLLGGYLFKWFKLYHRAPPKESWIWSWFPDGAFWKDAVHRFGDSAVDVMIADGSKDDADDLPRADKPYNFRSSSQVAVFYNIFIPEDEEGGRRALGIVRDQINQIGSSHMVTSQHVNDSAVMTLYYNTIGTANTLSYQFMNPLCRRNKLDCRHMKHYDNGFEEVTLQRVHEFCESHTNHKVIYIHSKGSYHKVVSEDVSQDAWRRNMMNAVTSAMCVDPPNDQCNVCGMLMLPFPSIHYSGNFFTAKCDYVKKLIPPNQFSQRMGQVVSKALYERSVNKRLVMNLLDEQPHHFGVGRFAPEHWIGSHPSIEACDIAPTTSILEWQQHVRNLTDFEFAMFPRYTVEAPWSYVSRMAQTIAAPHLRRREYFLLAGNVLKWFELYNEAPPKSSWVWQWYPDGKDWLNAVEKFGRGALDSMTQAYVEPGHQTLKVNVAYRQGSWLATNSNKS